MQPWSNRIVHALLALVVGLTVLYLALPALIVMVAAFNADQSMAFPPSGLSLRWFRAAVSYPDFQDGFVNSLIVTAWTSTLAVALGTLGAYAIERHEFRGKRFLDTVLLLPLVIPHFTVGLAFLILAANAYLMRTYTVVVITHIVLVLPFVMRNIYVSLKNLDPAVGRAAQSLGAPPWTVFLRIDLPLILPGVLGGWLFAAILSFNEVTASMFVTVQRTQTLPVAMYTYVREYSNPSMAALSTLSIAVTAILLALAERFLGLRRVLAIEEGKS